VLSDVRLRVVPAGLVHPHEIADPARERRIERRLVEDDVLRDPLVAGEVPDVEGYILLDGTNRKRALENLGLPGLLVQVVDYADLGAVQLKTWCHLAALPAEHILAELSTIPEISTEQLSPLAAPDALHDPATLAVLLDARQRVAVMRAPGSDRHVLLRSLVGIYEETLTRADCEPETVEEVAAQSCRADDARCLVAFPPFTRAQVVALAVHGTCIPAGITRHVILGGRALRINLSLHVLEMAEGVEAANRELQDHLAMLTPRAYTEPTVLFDS
jgi:hypothetical protein